MPGPKDDELGDAVTTPRGADPRTTPYGETPTTPYRTPPATDSASETQRITDSASLMPLAQRYEILSLLGRGGMGVVYRARDKETGDTVALKVLQQDIASDREAIERFKSELLLARKVTHPNVCRVHELLRLGDVSAISMEYVEDESLRSLLKRVEGLSVRHGLKIAKQICAGLSAAHAQGVVHRDLKPENILIARDGTIKVMDFGIARSLDAGTHTTGHIIGTPAYMSPEQAEGKTADHRSDIYSLGLVLCELFTGKHPFTDRSGGGSPYKRAPIESNEIDPELPAALREAIIQCIAVSPERRFQNVADVDARLFSRRTEISTVEQATTSLPDHLLRLNRFDPLVLLAGLLGLTAYLYLQEGMFPAKRLQVVVDRSVAIRLVMEQAERLGLQIKPLESADLEFATSTSFDRESISWNELVWRGGREKAVHYLNAIAPVQWAIELGERGRDSPFYLLALVNATDGTLILLSHDLPDAAPSFPIRPPTEVLRQRARAEIASAFHLNLPSFTLEYELVGSKGSYWTYSASFFSSADSLGTRTRHRVVLTDGKVTFLARSLIHGVPVTGKDTRLPEKPALWRNVAAVLVPGCLLVVLILLGRRGWVKWKLALGLAILSGFAYAYTTTDVLIRFNANEFLQALALQGVIGYLGFTATMGLAERAFPHKPLSFRWIRTPGKYAISTSLIRGVLFGFLFLGLQNVVAELGLRTNLFWVEPRLYGYPLFSNSPVVYGLANGIHYALLVSLIGVILPLCLISVCVPKMKLLPSFGSALWLALLVSGNLNWMVPWPATTLFFFASGLALGAIFVVCDLATVVFSVFTFVFWNSAYPDFILLSRIGAGSFYIGFALWVSVLAGALAAYFQSSIRRGIRAVSAVFD